MNPGKIIPANFESISYRWFLLVWLLLIGFPALYLKSFFSGWISDREEILKIDLKRKLASEMKEFKEEFEIPNFLRIRLDLLEKRLGFVENPREEDIKNVRNLDVLSLKNDIEKATGIHLTFLFFYKETSDGIGSLDYYLKPDAPLKNFPASFPVIKEFFRKYFSKLPLPDEISDEEAILRGYVHKAGEGLFGGHVDLTMASERPKAFQLESSKSGLAYYVLGICGPRKQMRGKKRLFNHACYLAIFDSKDIGILRLIRGILGRPIPGRKRWIFAKKKSDTPGYFQRGNRIFHFGSLPMGIPVDSIRKAFSGKIPFNREIMLAINLSTATSILPLRQLSTILELTLFLIAVSSLLLLLSLKFKQFSLKMNLRQKVALGFVLGAFIPVLGLTFVTFAYIKAKDEANPTAILDHMRCNLERFELGLKNQTNNWCLKTAKMKENLEKLFYSLSEGGKVTARGKNLIRGYISRIVRKEDIGNAILFYESDGTPYDTNIEGNIFLNLDTINRFFWGISIGAFMKMGVFAPEDNSAATEVKFQSLVAVAQSLADDYFDEKIFQTFLANPETVFPSPLGNPKQKFSLFFVRTPPPERKILGLGIIVTLSANDVQKYIRNLLLNRGDLLEIKNGFKIKYFFFEIESFLPPAISRVAFGSDRQKWLELLPTVQACIADKTNFAQNNLQSENPNLTITRWLGDVPLIGVGYAVPIEGKRRYLILPALFFSALILLWSGITATAALYLTWYLPAFVKAAQDTAGGNFDWQLQINSGDEFETLAGTFNNMVHGLVEREKMSRFVSEEIIDSIKKEEQMALTPGGNLVSSTVMFSDIRSFTSLTEANPPEEIVTLLNDYFTAMEACIKKEKGMIYLFLGDAILAVFQERAGEPASEIRACKAAFEMRKALEAFNSWKKSSGKLTIQTGIGIASGTSFSGRIGSPTGRMVQVVLGDQVERAKALESLTKFTSKSRVLIDSNVAEKIQGFFQTRSVSFADSKDLPPDFQAFELHV